MGTIEQFIAANKLKAFPHEVDENPNMASDEWGRNARHWRVRLTTNNGNGRRSLTVYFSQGSAYTKPPTAADVLSCLASDCVTIDNTDNFEEWAHDLGYDPDSRRAEHTYKVCKTQSGRLQRFLGADAYHTLLWDTEPL